MRILVTGSRGFLGGAFARAARARGHQVFEARQPWRIEAPPWEELERFAPELCLHAAWVTTPGVYLESVANIDLLCASIALIRGLIARGLERVCALGTCIEYAPSEAPLKTDSRLQPSSTYATCKDLLRARLHDETGAAGVRFDWCRVFFPYGPGEHPARLVSLLRRAIAAGDPVTLRHPDSTRDYIFIDDIASALLAIAERSPGGVWNICRGEPVSARTIAHRIAEQLNAPLLLEAPEAPAPDPRPTILGDPSALKGLGWAPAYDLSAGLAAYAMTRGGAAPGSPTPEERP